MFELPAVLVPSLPNFPYASGGHQAHEAKAGGLGRLQTIFRRLYMGFVVTGFAEES
jgi:hypothetical protein